MATQTQFPMPGSRWSALSRRMCRCMQSLRRRNRYCSPIHLLSKRPAPWPMRMLCSWAPRVPVCGAPVGKFAKTRSAEGPILVDSDVDTDDDSGESGGEPDGNVIVGTASANIARSRRPTLPLRGAGTTRMDVGISPWPGPGRRRTGS